MKYLYFSCLFFSLNGFSQFGCYISDSLKENFYYFDFNFDKISALTKIHQIDANGNDSIVSEINLIYKKRETVEKFIPITYRIHKSHYYVLSKSFYSIKKQQFQSLHVFDYSWNFIKTIKIPLNENILGFKDFVIQDETIILISNLYYTTCESKFANEYLGDYCSIFDIRTNAIKHQLLKNCFATKIELIDKGVQISADHQNQRLYYRCSDSLYIYHIYDKQNLTSISKQFTPEVESNKNSFLLKNGLTIALEDTVIQITKISSYRKRFLSCRDQKGNLLWKKEDKRFANAMWLFFYEKEQQVFLELVNKNELLFIDALGNVSIKKLETDYVRNYLYDYLVKANGELILVINGTSSNSVSEIYFVPLEKLKDE